MLRRGFLCVCLLFAAGGASAHRFHASLTDISLNPRNGNLEVVTSLMAHDIEAVLGPAIDISLPEGEARVREYMRQHFQLLGKDGRSLSLNWVGMQVNADSLLVYQEVEKADVRALGRIRNSILVEALPNQENTVNYQGGTYAFDQEKLQATVR